jgi:hypothetical protein
LPHFSVSAAISLPKSAGEQVDVATMYNTERYRLMYANKRGLTVFLQRAGKEYPHARAVAVRLKQTSPHEPPVPAPARLPPCAIHLG